MSQPATWSFLTNHARVLICIAQDPGVRLREIGEAGGITERAAHRIVADLEEAGYISRERIGRRNRYEFHAEIVMRHPPMELAPDIRMGDLVAPLMARSRSNGAAAGAAADGNPRARAAK
jgi:DNA-binding IclR family transcriptional regulator